jgi:GNAT superfamily N-acetyltransferase
VDGEPVITKMDADGVGEAVAWAAREGWDPGQGDADAFFAADRGGFFHSRQGGRTVATISAVRVGRQVAFVGLYIVEPSMRGRGNGKALWDHVLGGLEGVTLGLDAVPEQAATYESDGFEIAYGNARYFSADLPAPDRSVLDGRLVSADRVDFDSLAAFDGEHFFGPRPDFLRLWITGPGRAAVVLQGDGSLGGPEGGQIRGFAASRRSQEGHRIGPVFAPGPEEARQMILTLAAGAAGRVAVDVPLANAAAVDLLEALGMERSFQTFRMYRGEPPKLPLERIFGVTTLELG